MEYTKNYHLPQWVETDRIMMRDFNQMCKDIESGLTENASSAAAAAGAAADAAAVAGAAVTPSAMQNGLFRMAYNHYHLAEQTEVLPSQNGVLRQPFAEGAKAIVTGFLQEKDFLWAANGTELLTIEDLRTDFKTVQALTPTQGTMVVTFTAPHPGLITELRTYGRTTNSTAGDPGNCTVRLINQTNRTAPILEHEEHTSFDFLKGNSYGGFVLPVHFLLHTGQRYRLEVEMDNLSAKPDMQMERAEEFFEVTGYQTANASVSCSFQAAEAGKGGLALIRYSYAGSTPELKLTWGDSQLSPHRIRTFTDEQGRTTQEAEFRQTGLIPANSTLKINCTCHTGGDISLYQLGAVLL